MSTQDKLVEALRVAREWLNSDKWRNSTIEKHKSWKAMMRGIAAALAEFDARGAEAEQDAKDASNPLKGWIFDKVDMGRGDERYICTPDGANATTVRNESTTDHRERMLWLIADAMLAAAPQPQAAEPIVWVNSDDLANPNFVGTYAAKQGHPDLRRHYTIPLYAHPQPAQDAKDAARYRHMIETSPFMCFGASEYHKKSDLDEAIDDSIAAMAKESGR